MVDSRAVGSWDPVPRRADSRPRRQWLTCPRADHQPCTQRGGPRAPSLRKASGELGYRPFRTLVRAHCRRSTPDRFWHRGVWVSQSQQMAGPYGACRRRTRVYGCPIARITPCRVPVALHHHRRRRCQPPTTTIPPSPQKLSPQQRSLCVFSLAEFDFVDFQTHCIRNALAWTD